MASTTSRLTAGIKIRCPFCRQAYRYTPDDAGATIIAQASTVQDDLAGLTGLLSGNPAAYASLVFGIIAAMVGWIPREGLLAIPSGGISLILAVAGVMVASRNPKTERTERTLAAVGGGLGLVAIIVAFAISWRVEFAEIMALEAELNAPPAPVPAPAPPVAANPAPLPAPPPVAVAPVPPARVPRGAVFAPPPDLFDPGPAAVAPRQARLDPNPVPMGVPAVLNDVEIRVIRAELGPVALRMRNRPANRKASLDSDKDYLSLFLEVKNASRVRKIDYQTMAGPFAKVTDNLGNVYNTVNFGAKALPMDRVEAAPLLPDRSIIDQFVFEAPVAAAAELTLEIPVERAGAGTVALRFKIPAESVVPRPGP
jgi:hypothetical protein